MKQTAGELKASPPKIYCEVIDRLQTLTQLIYGSEEGKLQKKKLKPKAITRDKMGRNKN